MISSLYRCNHYLLITISVSFIAGIVYSGYVPPVFHHPYLFFTASALVCLASRMRLPLVTPFFLVVISFISGSMSEFYDQKETPVVANHVKRLVSQRQEVVLTGILDRMVIGDGQLNRAVIDLQYLRKKDMDHFVRSTGKILLTLNGKWPSSIRPGDALTARAFLKPPGNINTPGVFDYREHLATQDIFIVGTIPSPLLVHMSESNSHSLSAHYFIERIRTAIACHLKTMENGSVSSLYRAMLLGDRSAVPDTISTAFKRSGTFHILAVSGLHMSLLSFFLYFTFHTLFKYSETLIFSVSIKKLSLLCCIPVLLLYTFLAGANPPVVRSFIMAFLAVCALCSDRITSPLTIVSCAALIMMVFDPSAVLSASFQLSFAAVISIIIITPKILAISGCELNSSNNGSFVAKAGSWAIALICVSLSATIGTAPILIYHFNQISTVAVPANLLVEPLICFWGLPFGFLALPFIFFSPSIADFLFQTGSLGIGLSVKILTFLSSLEFSNVWLPDPPGFMIIIYYLALILLFSIKTVPVKITSGIFLCITAFSFIYPPLTSRLLHNRNSTVTFIDIGQGSSSLIELEQGGTLLIDGGALSAPGFNSGERIIAPFLWHRGIGRIDDIILTHADSDHYSGLEILVQRFHPKRLWLPVVGSGSTSYLSLVNTALNMGTEILYPEDESVTPDHLSRIRIIDVARATGKNNGYTAGKSKNDCGLIVKTELNGTSFLFPGDISAQKERALVDSGIGLRADILLSPHHGSSTSNSRLFLSEVDADYLIVSSSDHASLHFPSEQTMENARAAGTSMLRTVRDGTISVTANKEGYQVSCYRDKSWGTCSPEI